MANIHKVLEPPSSALAGDLFFVKTDQGIRMKVAGEGLTPEIIEPITEITITGPTSLFVGQTGNYLITAATDAVDYVVSSADGVIVQSGYSFTFVVNNAALTEAVFTINGWSFVVPIVAIQVMAPAIEAPVNNAENIAVEGLIVYSSDFALNWNGASDSLVKTDWEISTDPEFQVIVASSYNDTVNLTSFPVPVT